MARRPTPEERALWALTVADAKPLKRRGRSAAKPKAAPPEPKPEPPPEKAAAKPRAKRLLVIPPQPPPVPEKAPIALDARHAPGLDKSTAERFRRGKREMEVRLDLHGLTQDAAWRRLVTTVERAHREGQRTVLVITGKGAAGGGVLRQSLPRWLTEAPLKAMVLAHATAQAKDGGGGALYVLLRRKRA